MEYIYFIFGGIILIMLVAIYLLRRYIKNRTAKKSIIPPEVLKDFEDAEKMFKDNKGRMTQQQVLWELNKKRMDMFLKDYPDVTVDYPNEPSMIQKPKISKLQRLFNKR